MLEVGSSSHEQYTKTEERLLAYLMVAREDLLLPMVLEADDESVLEEEFPFPPRALAIALAAEALLEEEEDSTGGSNGRQKRRVSSSERVAAVEPSGERER